jgi:ribosomal protein S18 acetylase RimI-like enzyme
MTLDAISAPSLRAITRDDLPFLFRVYASTREEELARVPWTDEQKEAFLRQQFEAQHAWWQEHYTGASFDVVLVAGKPAGRLYVDEWEREIRIVDIALLPEYRGAGLGARLVREVLARGDAAGKAVSIHVERNNPALRLYERLGFRLVEDKGVYLLMSRPPQD